MYQTTFACCSDLSAKLIKKNSKQIYILSVLLVGDEHQGRRALNKALPWSKMRGAQGEYDNV